MFAVVRKLLHLAQIRYIFSDSVNISTKERKFLI